MPKFENLDDAIYSIVFTKYGDRTAGVKSRSLFLRKDIGHDFEKAGMYRILENVKIIGRYRVSSSFTSKEPEPRFTTNPIISLSIQQDASWYPPTRISGYVHSYRLIIHEKSFSEINSYDEEFYINLKDQALIKIKEMLDILKQSLDNIHQLRIDI